MTIRGVRQGDRAADLVAGATRMPATRHRQAAPATLVSLAAILALALAGVVTLGGGQALASHVSCGDTITTDTTLHRDLVNCRNNGLVIKTDGVTVDLNGHTIDGDGTEFAGCRPRRPCDFGVLNDRYDGVTVRHGSVREFATGVLALRARHSRVLDISSSRNGFAGFAFVGSARSQIRNSSGRDNGIAGWFGGFASHLRVVHDSFGDNGEHGILAFHTNHDLIKENRVFHDGDHGMLIKYSNQNSIKTNRTSGNRLGILVQRADGNRVKNNRSVRDLNGILVDKGKRNLVAQNRVLRGGGRGEHGGKHGAGIRLEGAHANLIARNVIASGRGKDAVNTDAQAKHNLFRRNVARNWSGDGFDIEAPTVELTGNRALGNAKLGIRAVPGVIDGGGNEASGNGDPRQCLNIVCQ